jgi:hypothetical protein
VFITVNIKTLNCGSSYSRHLRSLFLNKGEVDDLFSFWLLYKTNGETRKLLTSTYRINGLNVQKYVLIVVISCGKPVYGKIKKTLLNGTSNHKSANLHSTFWPSGKLLYHKTKTVPRNGTRLVIVRLRVKIPPLQCCY